jgi:hypothetical protein
MDKGSMCQAFSEEVTNLVLGVNLDQGDPLGGISYLVTEPMVLDGVVLGSGSYAARLQAAKG